VPFGKEGSPDAPLPDAVLASTAIPGVFPPVKLGESQYVDGGAFSATSLDLAAEECDTILCIAPLGYRNEGSVFIPDPKMWAPMLTRAYFARSLAREVKAARAAGREVFVIRPGIEELRSLGTNAMRQFDRAGVAEASRVSVTKLLEANADHPAVAAARAPKTARARSERGA
jgi:NTE family protein